jgi:hypothetical protein
MTRSYYFSGNRQFFAPRILFHILHVPIPLELAAKADYRYKYLSDLDKDSIEYFGYHTLECLFDLMASRIQKAVLRRDPEFINTYLGTLPKGLKLEDLNLKVRTYNCLRTAGIDRLPEKLSSLTFGDVLRLKSFGSSSLLDLLMAIETVAPESMITESHISGPTSLMEDRDWLIEANRIAKAKHSELIYPSDSRLGHLVKQIYILLSNRLKSIPKHNCSLKEIAEIAAKGVYRPSDPRRLAILMSKLRSAVRKKARMTVKEELEDFLSLIRRKRNRVISARRLGWDGCGGRTLQAVGNEFGLTRERIRQIESRLISRLHNSKIPSFAPVLDRSLDIIMALIPRSEEKITIALVEEGIITDFFDLRGIITAGRILDREVPFAIKTSRRIRLVVPLDFSGDVVWEIAKGAIRYWGVSTIADTAARVSERTGKIADSSYVVDALKLLKGFEWLDEERGWYWISSIQQNRLVHQIEKILSVAPCISINELREGVRRPYFLKGFAPPRKVLLEVCSRMLGCSVEADRVIAKPAPAQEDVLGNAEYIMTKCLLQNGPLILGSEFEKLCTSMGMTRSNFYRHLGYSPIITRYSPSVYGLRGAEIGPGLAEDVAKHLRRTKLIQDHGWTDLGEVWVLYKLSDSAIHNGVVTIPTSLRNVITGTYKLKSEEGERMADLVVKDNQARGLTTYFKRRGGEVGDILLLVFELKTSTVIARLGDDDLSERASSGELWQADQE